MKIKEIHYHHEYYIGDRQHDKFTVIASLEENDSFEETVEKLRQMASKSLLPNKYDVLDTVREKQLELLKLNQKIATETERWNEIANFMRTQGLNPEAKNFPFSPPALAPAVEAEIVDDEDNDDDDDGDDDY